MCNYNYNNNEDISSIDDVKAFACYLIKDLGINLHPDTDFKEYINLETLQPTFSLEEAESFNELMEKCFFICERENKDIYEIMSSILINNYNKS